MSLRSLASALADTLADGGWRAKARPEQLPPPGDWNGWLVMAGRGFGKTRTGAEWIKELVETGAARHVALIGATAGDVRDIMIEGSAGILAVSSPWCRPEYEPSKRRLTWPTGATASAFSSEESDRLRGPQHDALWADELASWNDPQATWDMAQFGLRIGTHPKWLVTTTPRAIKLIRELLARKDVVTTRGSTFANAVNLAAPFLETIHKRYAGTRLGRQELDGDLLSDTPGALWQLAWLDAARVEKAPELERVVVAIDPAVTSGEDADETGIIVAGVAGDHAYVLEDASGRYQPHEWAQKAINLYRKHSADRIIAEINNGGAMVESTIRMVDPNVSYRAVHASRGKVVRAEPVSALYEQSRVHHVGTFASLEDQLCSFTSDFDRNRAGYSPDRLDALVWALTELMVSGGQPAQPVFGTYGRNVPSNRFGYIPGGDDSGAGAIYASRPPEFWAEQGIFHPSDRQMWIDRGVYKPPEGP
jgi:phage terminase large subunit-like protein